MESNGKAGHIHLSPQANELLLKNYPEYRTESRGDVIIKVEKKQQKQSAFREKA